MIKSIQFVEDRYILIKTRLFNGGYSYMEFGGFIVDTKTQNHTNIYSLINDKEVFVEDFGITDQKLVIGVAPDITTKEDYDKYQLNKAQYIVDKTFELSKLFK